jgi:hypothetical protein
MMLQVEVSRKPLRELTPEELELVAGGGITITGERNPDFSLDDLWFQIFGWDFGGDQSGGGGGSTGSDPTPTDPLEQQHAENTKAAAEKVSAITAALQDIVNAHPGQTVMIKTADGSLVPATEMLHGLGEISTMIQGAATLAQIANGDADAHEAFSFVFGVAVEAMAADAGWAAVPAYVAGYTAETISNNIVDWLTAFQEANAYYSNEINQELQQYLVENGYTQPGATDNPVDVIRGMLGMPPAYRDGTTPDYQ